MTVDEERRLLFFKVATWLDCILDVFESLGQFMPVIKLSHVIYRYKLFV